MSRAVGLVFLVAGVLAMVTWDAGVAGAAAPVVVITPGATGGLYPSGQSVTVSVGPNSLFVPHTRVVILECADPGGSAANLPTSIATCDENTVVANSVLVQSNGSFSASSFTLYSLPNATLGEQANAQPVCDGTHKCVLFVGENQDDFSQPKIFSAAFAFTSAPSASAGAAASTASTTTQSGSAPSAPSAAVSVSSSALAFTGTPGGLEWLVASGGGLVVCGLIGRRLVRRRAR
jgi:hypothetical protein